MVLRQYIEQGGVIMLNIVMYVVPISFFCLITLICPIFSKKYCKDGFIV
jgi:hypothetical protein